MIDRDKISYFVTEKEYKLLLAATLLDQPYEGFVKRARLAGDRYRLQFTVKQLKAFVKYLDFEKTWLKSDEKRRQVRNIIARLRECLRLMSLVVSNN